MWIKFWMGARAKCQGLNKQRRERTEGKRPEGLGEVITHSVGWGDAGRGVRDGGRRRNGEDQRKKGDRYEKTVKFHRCSVPGAAETDEKKHDCRPVRWTLGAGSSNYLGTGLQVKKESRKKKGEVERVGGRHWNRSILLSLG